MAGRQSASGAFIAVAIAIGYGLAGWWAVAKGRRDFDDLLRPLQTKMAIWLCGLALFLALPILDFGAISANSQIERLAKGMGVGKVDEFDWRAMAFDFGPAGRERLAEIAKRGTKDQRTLAATALKSKTRDDVETDVAEVGRFGPQASTINVFPTGTPIQPGLRAALLGGPGVKEPLCNKSGVCRLFLKPGATIAIAFLDQCAALPAKTRGEPGIRCSKLPGVFELRDGKWSNIYSKLFDLDGPIPRKVVSPTEERAMLKRESQAMDRGDIEVRTIERRQLFIGGEPSGNVFE